MCRFPCGKWLGRGMDDGSIERLLVGEMVPRHVDSDELIESCMTPPRCRSPSIPRRSVDPKISTPDLQQMLGNKTFYDYVQPKGIPYDAT
jgi:DENN domain-containing protein 5